MGTSGSPYQKTLNNLNILRKTAATSREMVAVNFEIN